MIPARPAITDPFRVPAQRRPADQVEAEQTAAEPADGQLRALHADLSAAVEAGATMTELTQVVDDTFTGHGLPAILERAS